MLEKICKTNTRLYCTKKGPVQASLNGNLGSYKIKDVMI